MFHLNLVHQWLNGVGFAEWSQCSETRTMPTGDILTFCAGSATEFRMRAGYQDTVGLTGREKWLVRTYSHGMRARLALAQALLPQPNLLILDEPSDGLDPEGIHEMRATILRLRRELGLTIFLSSHLLNEVELLCGHIAVMNHGRKVFDGSIGQTKSAQVWVRLKTSDFAAATALLRSRSLISNERGGEMVQLTPNTQTDEIVRCLVGQGFPVFEICRQEQSLEDFYLSLMKESAAAP